MKRLRRPMWTYRPLLCMVGWHMTSQRRVPALVPRRTASGDVVHETRYKLIKECDRFGCTFSKDV